MTRPHRLLVLAFTLALLPALASGKSKPKEEAAEEEEGEGKGGAKVSYVALEPAFVTNFTDERIRYIRTDVSIKVKGEKTQEAIREHTFAIRHHLIMLLNRQTDQDLRSIEGRTQLAQDATAEVITVLQSESSPTDVEEVLFTSFVIN